MKIEIEGLAEIKQMVDGFYARVQKDDLIGPIFEERIADWEPHLANMYQFWNGVLFGVPGFSGQPFPKHMAMPLYKEHFDRWLMLFNENLDEQFTGPIAEEARLRARNIATLFLSKLTALRHGV